MYSTITLPIVALLGACLAILLICALLQYQHSNKLAKAKGERDTARKTAEYYLQVKVDVEDDLRRIRGEKDRLSAELAKTKRKLTAQKGATTRAKAKLK